MEIDEIDRQILQILEDDPRISNTKISEKLKDAKITLTSQAVGIRIKKLKDAGVIGGIKILKPLPEPSKVARELKRFQTKIPGLDIHLGGGFPNPSVIFLIGESGVGTTTFCLKVLWTAINAGMNCAYFTLERPTEQVIQQLKSFGWDVSQSENVRFINIYESIYENVGEAEFVSNIDILKIYREMVKYHAELWSKIDLLIIDSYTDLIKLVKGSPIEIELINRLCIGIMKHKTNLMTFYVLKPHGISENSLLTLKTYADCIIHFRKELENQTIRRYLLIEKMLFTQHTTSEIEFQITNQGIILKEYMLQLMANQNPILGDNLARFNVPELDYLIGGLPYGTTWVLETDSIFPLTDLAKLYINFFIDGIARQEIAHFVIPNVPIKWLLHHFRKTIQKNKELKKEDITLEKLINKKQLNLYDIFQKSLILKKEGNGSYFEPMVWSSDAERNLRHIGLKLTEQRSKHTYIGLSLSDLIDAPFGEEKLRQLYKSLIQIIQKRNDILLMAINPALHSDVFVKKLWYDCDGIIRFWVNPYHNEQQNKYIQIIKTPQGTPSPPHQLKVNDDPPYFQIV